MAVGLSNSAKVSHRDRDALSAVHLRTNKPNLSVLQIFLCLQFAALVSIANSSQWLPIVSCCLLCWVGDPISCTDVSHTTLATFSQNVCRGGVVAVTAVFIVDQTQPRLAFEQQQADSSNRKLNTVLGSNSFPQMVLLTVGSATCAAHIALGILEDHARVFHGEEVEQSALCLCIRHL